MSGAVEQASLEPLHSGSQLRALSSGVLLRGVDRAADVENSHRRLVADYADGDLRVALFPKLEVVEGILLHADPAGHNPLALFGGG